MNLHLRYHFLHHQLVGYKSIPQDLVKVQALLGQHPCSLKQNHESMVNLEDPDNES